MVQERAGISQSKIMCKLSVYKKKKIKKNLQIGQLMLPGLATSTVLTIFRALVVDFSNSKLYIFFLFSINVLRWQGQYFHYLIHVAA